MKKSDKFQPTVYGYGYIGVGSYAPTENNMGKSYETREYHLWKNMIKRCFHKEFKEKHLCYREVTLAPEWLNFQTFAEWCNNQVGFSNVDDEGFVFQLDKDLLAKDNKVYNPERCLFLPRHINALFAKRANSKLPVGVCYCTYTDKYLATITRLRSYSKKLGRFDTPEEAFLVYKKAKESYIKDIAEKYREVIHEKAYRALLNFTVEPY